MSALTEFMENVSRAAKALARIEQDGGNVWLAKRVAEELNNFLEVEYFTRWPDGV